MRLPTWITPTRAALGAIVLIATFLRLWQLGDLPPGLYPDEATNGNDALAALSGAWNWFYPNNNGREGLFINLQAIALAITGIREAWVLRIVAALAGIATIPGIYLLGRELWSRRVGLLSAALLAGSFWHVAFSRIGFRAIMAPLFLVWALAFLIMGIRATRSARIVKGRLLMITSGALAGVGLHTYIAFRVAALAFIATCATAFWSAAVSRKQIAIGSVLAGLAALVIASPLLTYFATHPGSFSGRTQQVSVFSAEHPLREIGKNIALTAGMLVWRGDGNWRHNDAGTPALPLVVTLCVVIGVGYSVKRIATKHGKDVAGITLLALVVVGAAPSVISGEGMPHALRSILLIVPIMLLAGLGLDRVYRWYQRRRWNIAGAVMIGVVVLYGIVSTAITYPAYARRSEVRDAFSEPYVALGKQLLQRDRSRDAYVVVPHGDVLINGIPVAAQTVMFITNTVTPQQQQKENIFYVTSEEHIPDGAVIYRMY